VLSLELNSKPETRDPQLGTRKYKEASVPKIKTNRGAAKRFRITGSGKIKRNKGFKSHLLSGKARKRKRQLREAATVSPNESRNMRKLIPYK
jgi:large subunit ribosomal protein L35